MAASVTLGGEPTRVRRRRRPSLPRHGGLKAIVEALIFASPEPLTPKTLCKLLAEEPKEDVLGRRRGAEGRTTRTGRGCSSSKWPAAIRS